MSNHHTTINQANTQPQRSVSLLVRGLRIEAEGFQGGVVNLAVRADQQHKGVLGHLRQHLANALFRAADVCHPSQNNGPLWVIERMVGGTPLEHHLTGRAEDGVRHIWPLHDALGQAHYNSLVVREGVKRHQDSRVVSERFLRRGGQKAAVYSHVDLSGLKSAIVDAEGGAAGSSTTIGWQTRRTFRLFGARVLIQTTAQQHDCPQCAGHGMWRPPYARERVPCDLCTSAPISQASATTSASSAPFASKA